MSKINLLSEHELNAIHQATLRILGETGIVLRHPEASQLLTDAGAERLGERVILPPELVEKMLAQCPSQVSLRGRGGSKKILGDGSLHWHNLGGAPNVYEPGTRNRRPAVLQDVIDSTRLLDALQQVTSITPFFTPQDVPGHLMALSMYRHALPHTTKPLQGAAVQGAAEARYMMRMAEVLGPPHETLTMSVSPVSPLFFPDEAVETMLEVARWGVPLGPLPCPTAGTTAPLTLAGALAQQNAEVLASMVIAQLAHPGLPIIYCGRLAMMEPRTGISVWGGAELALASAATVQLGYHYHLPVNVYGFSTNAHTLDLQNGFERALNAAIPALAGADELSGIGEMEAGVMSSYAQMVIDNELAASVHRLRRGIQVTEDTLAVEVVAAAMAGTRNFLGQKHTRQALRQGEMLLTQLAERRSWEAWEHEGNADMAVRAQAEADRLLTEHQVEPLDTAQERALDEMMHHAEKELVFS